SFDRHLLVGTPRRSVRTSQRDVPTIDFVRGGLILNSKCGGAAMAESLVPRRREWRPLEPDAGNAVEGSEGPIPDWRCQPCDFPRMAFYFMYHGLHGCRRWPQS